MKYYISKTDVSIDASGKLTGAERVLTKPDTLRATKEALRRYRALGIDNLHLSKHPANSRRWGKLQREQNKLRKTRKMTKADLAEIEAALDEDKKDT